MSRRYWPLVAVTVASLTLAACDSSNDDDGEDPMTPPGGPGNNPGNPGGPGQLGGLDIGADFATIAARGPTDEPYALDASGLDQDLAMRFGGETDEPLDIDDDEDVVSVANRGR